jgi:hypothetical protein
MRAPLPMAALVAVACDNVELSSKVADVGRLPAGRKGKARAKVMMFSKTNELEMTAYC